MKSDDVKVIKDDEATFARIGREIRMMPLMDDGKERFAPGDIVFLWMATHGVDIGGIDGMVHVSELSWGRIHQPSEVLSVGDEIEVVLWLADRTHDESLVRFAEFLLTQAADWTEEERSRYFYVAQLCDFETVVQPEFTPDCMIKRNRYMVDKSSVLLAVFDGTFGGTMQTVNYARKLGLEIIEISP